MHASSRTDYGRNKPLPSTVVIDTHLARGAANRVFKYKSV